MNMKQDDRLKLRTVEAECKSIEPVGLVPVTTRKVKRNNPTMKRVNGSIAQRQSRSSTRTRPGFQNSLLLPF